MPNISKEQFDKKMNLLANLLEKKPLHPKLLELLDQLQKEQQIFLHEEYARIPLEHAADTMKIGYLPAGMPETEANKNFLAPREAHYRHLSRYRIVYGTVQDMSPAATRFPVLTTCAVNLSGTSERDLKDFTQGLGDNRLLNAAKYQQECEKGADFIVGTVKNQNKTRLIMPAFGVGVYIAKLAPEEKVKAKEIMYKAFEKAASKHKVKVEWLIWAQENDALATKRANDEGNQLSRLVDQSEFIKPVTHHDIITYSMEESLSKKDFVMLNPGSDRTVGGKYITLNPKTLEEQIAQKTILMELQSATFNPYLVDKLVTELKKLQAKTPAFSQTSSQSNQVRQSDKIDFTEVSKDIASTFKVTPPVIFEQGNIIVSFTDKPSAAKFASEIFKQHQIGSLKFVGQQKTVQSDNHNFFVALTKSQYTQLAQICAQQPPIQNKTNNLEINKSMIIEKGDNIFVNFKNLSEANQFVDDLLVRKIGSLQSPGKPKTVQQSPNGFFVVLSKDQYTHLTQASPESNQVIPASTNHVVHVKPVSSLDELITETNSIARNISMKFKDNLKFTFENNTEALNFSRMLFMLMVTDLKDPELKVAIQQDRKSGQSYIEINHAQFTLMKQGCAGLAIGQSQSTTSQMNQHKVPVGNLEPNKLISKIIKKMSIGGSLNYGNYDAGQFWINFADRSDALKFVKILFNNGIKSERGTEKFVDSRVANTNNVVLSKEQYVQLSKLLTASTSPKFFRLESLDAATNNTSNKGLGKS